MLKKPASREKDGPVSPLCSRNARPQQALVGRAQWGTHPGHPEDTVNERAWRNYLWPLAAALPAERRVLARRGRVGENRGHFEHPADSSEESLYVQSGSLSHKNPVFPQTVNVAGVLTS